MTSQQSKRATFEDVGIAQDTILNLIDNCINDNRPLNVDERKKFIKNLRLATLGLGTEYKIKIGKYDYPLGHLERACYWISYQTETPIRIKDELIDIRDIWVEIRDKLFSTFPYATLTSVKISKEILKMGTAKASDV